MIQLDDKLKDEKRLVEERVKTKKIKKQKYSGENENSKILQWFENVLILIQNYGLKKIFQALFVVGACVIFALVVNAFRDENLMKEFLLNKSQQHVTASAVRKEVDPKINKTLTRMLYSMNADRVAVLEMHNGKENPTSLPFLYCDMTYEETKENVPYVSEEYEDLNMSKFQFPSFLYKNKVFYGSIEEVIEIDKKLGMRLELNDVKFIGMILIRTSTDIGFITISWMEEPEATKDSIIADLTYYVQEIGTYLDYGQYKLNNK